MLKLKYIGFDSNTSMFINGEVYDGEVRFTDTHAYIRFFYEEDEFEYALERFEQLWTIV